MSTKDYWKDCIAEAAAECDLKLTPEQLDCLAGGAEGGHEHYGMAFYSPSWSDVLGPNARTVRLRGPQPVRCEICQWRGRRLKPRSAPCPACGSRVEFA